MSLMPYASCGFAFRFSLTLAAAMILGLITADAHAERPIAPRLLPEQTLFYLRVANMPELREKFQETATGRMAQDEKLKPLLGQLWQSAVEAFQRVEDQVGAPLHELLAIPQGEICVALVGPREGIPQLIAWLDCGDRIVTMQKLLDRGEQVLASRGVIRSRETFGDVELVIHEPPNQQQRKLTHFIKDNTLVVSSDVDLSKQLLAMWTGEQEPDTMTLADNRKFTSIMSRSMGTKGEEPQVTWYFDPIETVRRVGRGNAGAQTALALLPGLGLDGVKGIGGSLLFASEEYDGIFHTHLLLDNPRKGVIEALAIQPGEVTPEPWVPLDSASYTTWNWDVLKTRQEVVRLYELFRGGEGTWKSQVLQPITDRTGIDAEKEVLEAVTGRFTMVTWIEKPARLNSQSTLIAIKLKDPAASQQVIERLIQKFPGLFEKKAYGGVTYFQGKPRRNGGDLNPELVRIQESCVAIFDDYFILTDSSKLLQQAILTKSDSSRTLANELDFKIIASKIQRQLGDLQAGMIVFNRPEEAMRQLYDMATSDTMRGALKGRAENNPFFKSLDSALTSNPLPPFSVLAQYLAPGGALLTSDETGFHYMAFSLRRDP